MQSSKSPKASRLVERRFVSPGIAVEQVADHQELVVDADGTPEVGDGLAAAQFRGHVARRHNRIGQRLFVMVDHFAQYGPVIRRPVPCKGNLPRNRALRRHPRCRTRAPDAAARTPHTPLPQELHPRRTYAGCPGQKRQGRIPVPGCRLPDCRLKLRPPCHGFCGVPAAGAGAGFSAVGRAAVGSGL